MLKRHSLLKIKTRTSAGSDIEVLLPMAAFYPYWRSTPVGVKAQPFYCLFTLFLLCKNKYRQLSKTE